MDAKRPNKIRDIVRLQQIRRKWKKLANASRKGSGDTTTTNSSSGSRRQNIKFLKKTLSFADNSASSLSDSNDAVPRGFLAVCVGKELKRYVIPTQYLGHQAFGFLLRVAEEEFGYHQEGVLKIPCEVAVFEMMLKIVEEKRDEFFFLHELNLWLDVDKDTANTVARCSPEYDLIDSFQPQLCR
ncbi:hypothetical protein Ancab_029228 [Ancistrocladus abbreviatus]